jgi:hypothetical protein
MPSKPPATDRLIPLNFRHRQSRKKMLEAFAAEDGYKELTLLLRDAVDFYTAQRMRFGKDAVRLDLPTSTAS